MMNYLVSIAENTNPVDLFSISYTILNEENNNRLVLISDDKLSSQRVRVYHELRKIFSDYKKRIDSITLVNYDDYLLESNVRFQLQDAYNQHETYIVFYNGCSEKVNAIILDNFDFRSIFLKTDLKNSHPLPLKSLLWFSTVSEKLYPNDMDVHPYVQTISEEIKIGTKIFNTQTEIMKTVQKNNRESLKHPYSKPIFDCIIQEGCFLTFIQHCNDECEIFQSILNSKLISGSDFKCISVTEIHHQEVKKIQSKIDVFFENVLILGKDELLKESIYKSRIEKFMR